MYLEATNIPLRGRGKGLSTKDFFLFFVAVLLTTKPRGFGLKAFSGLSSKNSFFCGFPYLEATALLAVEAKEVGLPHVIGNHLNNPAVKLRPKYNLSKI